MSESKHTPGPLYADKNGLIWRRPPSDLYENGGSVAGDYPVAGAYAGWYGEGLEPYPVQANAQLFAAAPELLEALEWLVTIQSIVSIPEAMHSRTYQIAVEQARAVIAKAKGEEV